MDKIYGIETLSKDLFAAPGRDARSEVVKLRHACSGRHCGAAPPALGICGGVLHGRG
ncbi:hypothetical protein [Rhodobacter ferrooxidans]|uniref:hypothetical protein n=1 Tax=Rhodobacter ferrooxidans TaxID=371731 RepID=UPI0003155C14|nr:hypothetical protein [Rhodobacter sp. SW2]